MNRLYLLILLVSSLVMAQNPYSINYGLEEGLPTSNIYSVLEDHNGFMWFSTDVGVLRFNGYDFEHFSTDDGLADNEILKMYEDSKQRLWFLSLNGKLSYYEENRFYNANNSELLRLASHQKMIMDVYENTSGDLYFLFRDGHVSIIEKNRNAPSFHELKLGSFSILAIDGLPFVITKNAISSIHDDDIIELPEAITSTNVYRSCMDSNGNYYFSIDNKLYGLEKNGVRPILEAYKSEIIYLNTVDESFLIGTRNGLIIRSENISKHYFKKHAISGAIKDSQGNYWITTLDDGIKFIPEITLLRHELFSGNVKVSSIKSETNGNLWVGTQKGVIKMVYNSIGNQSFQRFPKITNSVNRIRIFDHKTFVVGTESIQVFDESGMTEYPVGALDLLKDNDNYFFSSTINFKIGKHQLEDLKFFNSNELPKDLKDSIIMKRRTNVIAKGMDSHVFFGTSTGLYDYYNGNILKVNSLKEELNTSIIDMFFDVESNRLLLVSNSKGLVILEDGKTTHHITKSSGLNSNGCNAIKKLDKDTYFIGTNKGLDLVKLKDSSASVENFNTILKIDSEKINDIEIIDHDIFLATDTGLLSFDFNKIYANEFIPKILIDQVLVSGKEKTDINDLSYFENNLAISFTGISYIDYGDLRYEHKLNDDEAWTRTDSRQIEFRNLPDAQYNLSIRAVGRNNKYSSVKQIAFKINPPFWKTVPFTIIWITLVIAALFLITYYHVNGLKKRFVLERKALLAEQGKVLLEKETAQLEQKALRMQMNPHFVFNALNTIKGYYSGGDIHEANAYISSFSKLLRLILENDDHLVSIAREIEMLELYIKLLQLRYQNIFDFNISVSKNINKDEIGVPPLLLQPIVENSIIHGMAPNTIKGKLKISFEITNNQLVCSVIDNGIGLRGSQSINKSNHKSKALKITKERVQFLNNSDDPTHFVIANQDEESKGVIVVIKLPILKLW